MPNELVKWGRAGNQTEPPLTKRNAGAKAGRPEAAQYVNWLWDRLAAGANLDRREDCLLYMPLISNLDIERGVGTATFARSTTATYVDTAGVVQDAAVDEARFEAEGYLSEGASTNQFLHSEDFADAEWTKSSASVDSGVTTGPDGVGGSADRLVEDGTAGVSHFIRQAPDTAPGDDVICTIAFFVKRRTNNPRDWVYVTINRKDGAVARVWFNIDTGTVGTVEASVTSHRMRALADGWYRCEVSADVASGGNPARGTLVLADADGSLSYDGDGVSGVLLFGGQWENNLPFASSYIPTTAAAVTRAADSLRVQANGNVGRKSEPGTWLVDADHPGNTGGGQNILDSEETGGRTIGMSNPDGNTVMSWGTSGFIGVGTPDANTIYRFGMLYDGSDLQGWRDGVLVSTDDSPGDVSEALSGDLYVGRSSSGDLLWGHIRNVRIYNRALNDQEMSIA